MASAAGRIAAAQAHMMRRGEQAATKRMEIEMANQKKAIEAQRRRDRQRQKWGGIAQSVLGGGMIVGGALSSNPMAIGGGAGMLTQGIGNISGNEYIGQAAPAVGMVTGSIAGGLQDKWAAEEMNAKNGYFGDGRTAADINAAYQMEHHGQVGGTKDWHDFSAKGPAPSMSAPSIPGSMYGVPSSPSGQYNLGLDQSLLAQYGNNPMYAPGAKSAYWYRGQ